MSAPLIPEAGSNVKLVTTPGTGGSPPDKPAGPALSAVEEASLKARENLEKFGNPLGQPRVAPGDQAGRGGQFARSTVEELPGGQPDDAGRDPTAAPARGNERPAGDQPAPEGQQPTTGDKPAEGQPEGDQPAAEGDEKPELAVVVPALADDQQELHIELDDPEVAARLNDIVGQVSTIEQRETRILEAYDEIDQVRDSVTADPVGFALGMVQSDPAAVEHLVLGLLTQPDVWNRLKDKVAKIAADPNELRVVAAEQKGVRADYRAEAQTRIAEQREVRTNLQQVQAAVAAMIPEDVEPARAEEMYRVMLGRIGEYARGRDMLTFPVDQIAPFLTPTLTAFGLNPVEASQRAAKAVAKRGLPPKRSPFTATRTVPRTNGNGSGNGRPAPKKPDGQAFKASDERRRQAAAPSAGAGSPTVPNDLTPPRKPDGSAMSTEETIQWHRAKLKTRGSLLRASS